MFVFDFSTFWYSGKIERKSKKNIQNAVLKISNRSFSKLRHQILIIFGAKCSFTRVLSTYQLLSKSYDKQKLYFEKNRLLLNRFRQIRGFSKADFGPKPRFHPQLLKIERSTNHQSLVTYIK